MKERGILFGAAMVRAILHGTKGQTRRLVDTKDPAGELVQIGGRGTLFDPRIEHHSDIMIEHCPYGRVGDRLWVREAWTPAFRMARDEDGLGDLGVLYRADGTYRDVWLNPKDTSVRGPWVNAACYARKEPLTVAATKWRPSIHLPRVCARILLEVTEVRVERLHRISEADAKAEGVTLTPCTHPDCADDPSIRCAADSYRGAYAVLWNEINADRAPWGANPWVFAVSFRRVTQ